MNMTRSLAGIFLPAAIFLGGCASIGQSGDGSKPEDIAFRKEQAEKQLASQIAAVQMASGNPVLQANAVAIQRRISPQVDGATEWTAKTLQSRRGECVVTKVQKTPEGKTQWVARCEPVRPAAAAPAPVANPASGPK